MYDGIEYPMELQDTLYLILYCIWRPHRYCILQTDMAQFSGVPAKAAVSESLKFGHFLTYTYAHLWDYKQATPEIKKQWVTGERTMERKLNKKKNKKEKANHLHDRLR